MNRLLGLFALFAFLFDGDRTLITKKGEICKGKVTLSGDRYLVESAAGTRSLAASDVGCVFDNPREVVAQADERFAEAKKIYAEAEGIAEADPHRNQRILAAIEIAQGAATLCNLIEPHCRDEDKTTIARNLQLILQFIRLCRGAATSEIAGTSASAPKRIPLVDVQFAFKAPASVEHAWTYKDDLGPGLAAWARDLLNPDDSKRLEAVKRLSHPPAAAHLSTLLKLLENERSPEIVKVLSDGLAWQDPAVVLKSFAWTKREIDPLKRSIAFSVARAAADRAAFDFLLDWFAESPPAKHEDRAAFGAAFRQYHAWSAAQLRELLAKQRQPKLQMEILRQMGAVGDKAAAPMLVKAISSYPRDAVVSLMKLAKPAVPAIIEGSRSEHPEMRRLCIWLLRKITGVNTSTNTVTFENWWTANKKQVLDDEKAWWEEQARHGYAIPPAFFAPYDLPLEAIVN